jgi:hypothetical protein
MQSNAATFPCGASPTATASARACRQAASARWSLDLTVDDPHALVWVGPQQLVGGRPAGMLGLGVPLQVPGAEEPLAAALDRAAPLFPGLARVVEAEQGVWPGSSPWLKARRVASSSPRPRSSG